eukprot:3988644-Amphidinium_carterae.1
MPLMFVSVVRVVWHRLSLSSGTVKFAFVLKLATCCVYGSPVYFPSCDSHLYVSRIGLQDTATSAVGTSSRFHSCCHQPFLAMSFFELATDVLDVIDHDTSAVVGQSEQIHQDAGEKRTQSEDHGVAAKKPRLMQGRSSVAWATTLMDAVRNCVGNFEQRGALVTASLCSGVNSHTVALKDSCQTTVKECGLNVNDLYTVDRKSSAVRFMSKNAAARAEHHFNELKEMTTCPESGLQCAWHVQTCCACRSKPDLLVASPPCAPYSLARTDRWAKGFTVSTCPHINPHGPRCIQTLSAARKRYSCHARHQDSRNDHAIRSCQFLVHVLQGGQAIHK